MLAVLFVITVVLAVSSAVMILSLVTLSTCVVLCCVVQIAQAKFGRWSPSPSELSDVLWALAHARHWTPLLTQLESCIMTAGGAPACTAAEAVTSIWAFAVLGHTPKQLLQQLDTQGWTVKRDHNRPQQQQQNFAAAGPGGSSGVDRLAELRDSQLCTLAWSLACLQQVEGGLFRSVWVEVCRRGPALASDVRQAVQLAQAALAIQLEGSYTPQQLLPGEGEVTHRVHVVRRHDAVSADVAPEIFLGLFAAPCDCMYAVLGAVIVTAQRLLTAVPYMMLFVAVCVCAAGTSQLLAAASGVFRQQGAALQAQRAHSSYQRAIAGTLAKLRVMHVMEDTATGTLQ